MFLQLAKGLKNLHQHFLVHGDIRWQNTLTNYLDSANKYEMGFAGLMDYGEMVVPQKVSVSLATGLDPNNGGQQQVRMSLFTDPRRAYNELVDLSKIRDEDQYFKFAPGI